MSTTEKKVVTLSQRELNIDYNVDFTPVKDLATKYGIDFQDMKKALRDCGFTIRKNEPEPDAPERDYVVKVNLDGKNPVKAPKKIETSQLEASTTQAAVASEANASAQLSSL